MAPAPALDVFNAGNDTIELENAIFIGLGTGRLFFDQDGVGGVVAKHFATLGAGLVGTVGSGDFIVV